VDRWLPDIQPSAASRSRGTLQSSTSAGNRRPTQPLLSNEAAARRSSIEDINKSALDRRALIHDTAVIRATPVRSTRKAVHYRIESPDVSAVAENVESEWDDSPTEEDEESFVLENDGPLPSPPKVFIPKSVQDKRAARLPIKELASFVDLTISSDDDGDLAKRRAGRYAGMASRAETTTDSKTTMGSGITKNSGIIITSKTTMDSETRMTSETAMTSETVTGPEDDDAFRAILRL